MRSFSLILWSITLSSCLVSCGNSNREYTSIKFCSISPFECIKEKRNIEMLTNKGKITLQIDGSYSPLTAGNFLDLIKRGVYQNTVFHRVIADPIPFIVQGGDPLTKGQTENQNLVGTGSYIDPSTGTIRLIPLEISLKNESIPRYNQLLSSQDNFNKIVLTHKRGSLAMARAQALGSASSQFYISLRDLPELDGRYAVFGRVVKGMKIVDSLREGDYILRFREID